MTLLAFRSRPREADHIGSSNRPGGGRWPRDTPLHAGGAGRLERAVPNMALIQIYASRPGQGRAAPPASGGGGGWNGPPWQTARRKRSGIREGSQSTAIGTASQN